MDCRSLASFPHDVQLCTQLKSRHVRKIWFTLLLCDAIPVWCLWGIPVHVSVCKPALIKFVCASFYDVMTFTVYWSCYWTKKQKSHSTIVLGLNQTNHNSPSWDPQNEISQGCSFTSGARRIFLKFPKSAYKETRANVYNIQGGGGGNTELIVLLYNNQHQAYHWMEIYLVTECVLLFLQSRVNPFN